MERYINIVDYHQRKNNDHAIYDKQVYDLPRCPNPWESLVINQFGSTYICVSPAWLPKSIGTITDYDDIFSLLNSYEARSIRSEIDLNRYSYCNQKICGYLTAPNAKSHYQPPSDDGNFKLLTEDQFTDTSVVTKLPKEICFDFDYTCNFKCPSCRIDMINHNQGPMNKINKSLVEKIKTLIIDRYIEENIPLTIRWAGGEPLVSHAYLSIWEYIVERKAGNIKNIIQTNGSYLKKRHRLVKDFLPYINQLRISFDAGSAETYSKIRVNGSWEELLDNCKYIKDLIVQQDLKIDLTSDFVVQLDNFEEIPQYITMAKSLGFNHINLTKMWNWDTWSPEEFTKLNISDPAHPRHDELKKIIKSYASDNQIYNGAC